MRRALVLLLIAGFMFAGYQGVTGNGVDCGPTGGDSCQVSEGARQGRVRPLLGGDSQCLILGGTGYRPSKCEEDGRPVEGAIQSSEVVAAGDFGGLGHGAVLSMADVEALWVRQGGRPSDAHVAAAVATAESGRRPAAVNGTNTDGSADGGLFQINTVHRVRFEQVTGASYASGVYEVDANVRYAVHLQAEQGWKPWVAYTSHAYEKYL